MDEPWDDWTKDDLPRGFAYPVRQQDVRAALVASDTRVSGVRLLNAHRASWVGDRPPPYLLAVDRPGDVSDRIGGRLAAGPPGGLLSIWACPSDLKHSVGELMRDEVLPKAAAWLASVPARGDGWAASNHRLTVQWDEGVALVREDDR